MSPEEARREGARLWDEFERDVRVAHSDQRVGPDLFCVRIYTCDECGHETPTKGYPLPAWSRCHKRYRIAGEPVRTRKCGGKLRARYGGRS